MQRFQSCSALDVSNHSVESLEKHKKPQSAIWTYGTTTGGYQSDEELAWEDVFFPKKNIEEAPEEEEPTSSKTQDSSSKTQDSISDLSPQTIDSSVKTDKKKKKSKKKKKKATSWQDSFSKLARGQLDFWNKF